MGAGGGFTWEGAGVAMERRSRGSRDKNGKLQIADSKEVGFVAFVLMGWVLEAVFYGKWEAVWEGPPSSEFS